jgi:CSLREA domain-containing protein
MFPKAAVIVSIPLIIFLMLVGLVVGDSRIQSDFESQVGPARLSGATNSTSTVTKTTDSNDGVCNTDCSLREAIAVAASGTAIVIPVGTYTLALGSQLTIDRSLTLIGAQASTTIIQAATQPGTASFPVFGISNGDVEISDLTIRHGNATGNGGGISNSANLTLNGVRLTENRATASGGAVANFNTLIVTNSRFRNNHAGIQGGALYNDGFADLNGVTLSANTTDNAGGGIRNVLNRAVTLNNVNISERVCEKAFRKD